MKIFFAISFLILLLINNSNLYLQTLIGYNLWLYKLVPTMLPTLILMDFLLSSNFINIIANKFYYISNKILKINKYAIPVFLISIISGTPSNIKLINDLYQNKSISKEDITTILCLSYSFNPLFLINFINKKIIIILIISNIISTIILKEKNKPIVQKEFCPSKFNIETSIKNNFNITLSILGIIIFFYILNGILLINNILVKSIISGLLEITSGLDIVSRNMQSIGKDIFSIIIISLGSISIFLQIKSVLKDTSINIKYFILNRTLSLLISLSITIIIYLHN